MENIELERITIQDCMELFDLKQMVVTLENGKITEFMQERSR